MKKRSSIVLVCVIVIVIALAGIVGFNSLKESESNNKKVTTTEVITKNTDKEKETTT